MREEGLEQITKLEDFSKVEIFQDLDEEGVKETSRRITRLAISILSGHVG